MTRVKYIFGAVSIMLLGTLFITPSAQAATGNFSLQITPSPLVTTLKPGTTTELELKVRNASTETEQLKIESRRFRFDNATGTVKLDETKPAEIADWINYSAPTFDVKPGEWYTQKIRISLPAQSGFSYSFAYVISRVNAPKAEAGQQIQGSVALFTLINVDRPGATRKIDISSFTPAQAVFEYLPATLKVRLKNTGNTIVRPSGNVFIQRGSSQLATLPVNESQSYLLPGTERTLDASWVDGFPVYKTVTEADGTKTQSSLTWNFDKLSHFRIGRYTAKVVAIYNDGTRDIPITREVSFWVIPWKAILLLITIIAVLIYLIRRSNKLRTEKAVKKALSKQKKTS